MFCLVTVLNPTSLRKEFDLHLHFIQNALSFPFMNSAIPYPTLLRAIHKCSFGLFASFFVRYPRVLEVF